MIAALSGATGFLVGTVAYGWFAATSLGAWNQVVQMQFAIEQELRASRAERRGDLLAALHHRWNVVEAKSSAWMRQFETWERPAPWFPFQFLTLRKIYEQADPEGKGHEALEGIARGELARLLEVNGQPERAAHQWSAAAQLARQPDLRRMRELIASLHEQEATPAQLEAEEAVLGPAHVER